MSLRGATVLVTGAAGFIGSHLTDALIRTGARVRGLDNLSTGYRENLSQALHDMEFVEGDIRDLETCRRACEGVSVVFHQAALGSVPRSVADPATTFAVNVLGTANVFAAARDSAGCRVVYASSSSVYGSSTRLPQREGEEGEPLSPYALSKAMNEELAQTFTRCYGMEFVGLRYFNVFGPRQDPDGAYAAVIPRFFKACFENEAPVIYGDGEQSRDFTFVEDAVAANLAAAAVTSEGTGRAYNVAGGGATSVNEVARLVRQAAGSGLDPRHEPARPGDVKHSLADLQLSRTRLGYAARTALSEGLVISRDYFAERIAQVRP